MEECLKKVFDKKTKKAMKTEYDNSITYAKHFILAKKNNKDILSKNLIKTFKKRLKSSTLKKKLSRSEEEYRSTFCNPTCKDTLFEAGNPSQLSEPMIKSLKKQAQYYQFKYRKEDGLRERKQIFGTDKEVLKNGFYKGLDAKTIKKLRKRGAISGCYKDNFSAMRLLNPLI